MCISQRRRFEQGPWARLRVLLGRRCGDRLGRLLWWSRGWLRPGRLRGLLGTRSIVTRLLLHGAASLDPVTLWTSPDARAGEMEPSKTDPLLKPW